ncbi:MAG: methyltransferase domain-containing protein [Porticoccaceae bacterium]|nr:methyltransferase domain-containing protein [Porticoccaceae bacterium]|tara:strand:+ start:9560 stop:10213 length:654 start_codon:yes stop_codon:yes gene_type:complete
MQNSDKQQQKPVIANSSLFVEYLGIKALLSRHPEIRRLKRQQQGHSAHGNKVWRSSFVLMDYLTTYPPKASSKILDVGCGWGLTGIFLAKHYSAKVTGIDIDPSVETFLQLHASINKCSIVFQAKGFESFAKDDLSAYDEIIAADICFWDEMVDPLFDFIGLALEAGVRRILIADPGRPPFWSLCDKCVESHGANIVTRRIYEPWKTEKFVLIIENQ